MKDGQKSGWGDARSWRQFGKRVNLLDMIQFMAEQLARILVTLQDMETGARNYCDLHGPDSPVSQGHIDSFLRKFLSHVHKQCSAIELSAAIARVDLFKESLDLHLDYSELRQQTKVLREAIESELKSRQFVFVPTDRATKLDKIDVDWITIQDAFPSAKKDIRSATECYALDCNTAAVFHGMRIVEWGLRALCVSLGFRRLKQRFKKSGMTSYVPIEYSEWEKILNQLQERIDNKINKIKRGPAKQAQQEFYYPILQDIRGIRDAWRNHVMHTRQEYEPKDADAILDHVRRLMNKLATRVREV